MRRFLTLVIFAGSTLLAANASAQTFSEMPSRPGTYIADFGSVSGWKVFGLGTRDASACSAVKGELNAPRQPNVYGLVSGYVSIGGSGTGFVFQRDNPYSEQQLDNPIRLHVSGRYGVSNDNYEWRWIGDKFFTPLERGGRYGIDHMRLTVDELTAFEGKILDVKASSWEYPSINVGYSDDSAKVSLTGLAQLKNKIESCEKAIIQEFPSHYQDAVFTPVIEEPVVLPPIPQGWEKTEFGNYMAFKHEWLTFVYRKIKNGRDDTYFVVDMSEFGKVKASKRLELKIAGRNTYLSTSRYATNNFGEDMYPFTSLYLTPENYEALKNGSFSIEAKYRGEELKFDITDFQQAEEYRVKWNKLNPSR